MFKNKQNKKAVLQNYNFLECYLTHHKVFVVLVQVHKTTCVRVLLLGFFSHHILFLFNVAFRNSTF